MKIEIHFLVVSLCLAVVSKSAGAEPGFEGALPAEALAQMLSAHQFVADFYQESEGSAPESFSLAGEGLNRRISAEELEAIKQLALSDMGDVPMSVASGVTMVAASAYYHQTGQDEFLHAHLKPEAGLLPLGVMSVISLLPMKPNRRDAVIESVVEYSSIGKPEGADEDYELYCAGIPSALTIVTPTEMVRLLKPRLAARKLSPGMARALISALSRAEPSGALASEVRDWMTELYVELQSPFGTTNLAAILGERGDAGLQQHLIAAKRAHLQKLLDATSDEAIAQARRNMIPPSVR